MSLCRDNVPWEVQAAILSFLPVPPTVGCACPENCDEVFEAMSLPVRPLKKGWYSRHFKGTLGYVLVPLLDSLLTPPISQHTFMFLFVLSLKLAQLVFVISEKCHWISQYEGLAQIMGNSVNYRWKGGWSLAPMCS